MTKLTCLRLVCGVVCIVVVLCLVYFGIYGSFPILHPSTRVQLVTSTIQRNTAEKHSKNHKNGLGGIWPKSDNDADDRLMSQLQLMETYRGLNGTSVPGKRSGKMKVILTIGHAGFNTYKEGQSVFLHNKCPVNTCWMTMNESAIPTADAIRILRMDNVSITKFLPKPSNQIWITHHTESPTLTFIDPNVVKDLINWTTSYRRSSTIYYKTYGNWKLRKGKKISFKPKIVEHLNYAQGKTKKIAMLASNCQPGSNRMQYAIELQNYIEVDIYGACGNYQCPINDGSINRGDRGIKCVKWLSKRYKFYLAFENSICKDYITEKLLTNSLSNNILPIVLGASLEDYAVAAPPHSYIHVDEFSSPEHLASYLDILDKNDTLYNEYFSWKSDYELKDQQYECRLCMLLHLQEETGYRHWYPDYSKWWRPPCIARQGYSTT